MQTFEKLFMREEAKKLYVYVYNVFQDTKNKDTHFQNEILRSIFLIGGMIAQGYEINLADPKAYLREAKGFSGVCKNLAYIGKDLGYFSEEVTATILEKCSKISAGLYKFVTSKKKVE